jgi:hypothetical protein
MKTERDSDRHLRDWVAAGADRVPERFVWAALDEIERVPQRTAWRSRLDDIAVRLRPAAGLVGAAGVAIIAVAVVARVVAPHPGSGGSRDFVMTDLPRIVLWEDTKPSAWRIDNLVSNPWEVSVIPIRSMTDADIERYPEPDGLVAGRFVNGLTPDLAFMSWAALFESEAQAAAVLPFYEDEMAAVDAWGLGPGETIAFGDGGRLFTGETTAFVGPPTGVDPIHAQIYLWRDGNLLLAVGGFFDYDAAELRGVAEGVDARADALSEATR